MRRKLFLFGMVIFVLSCSFLVVSVDAASMWSQTYGVTGINQAFSLIATSDGGYALAGCTNLGSSLSEIEYFWLVKTDALGNMQWNKTYGLGIAYSIIATADGGYAVGGYSGSFWNPNSTLVKTDALGNMQWTKNYGQGFVRSLVEASDGGYILAGIPWFMIKTDSLGNMQWNRTYGGTAESVVTTADGGYALAGTAGDNDFWLVKTDASGNMQWSKTYGGTGNEYASSLIATLDGGYALAGTIYPSLGASAAGMWLVKTDASGSMQWNQTYGEDSAYSLVATSDGGYALTGSFLLVKTDELGNMKWNQTYFKQWLYAPTSLIAMSDGGYAIAGYTPTDNPPNAEAWLIKTDEFGVVPEYSSWLVPALVLTATAFIIINKKRLLHKRS